MSADANQPGNKSDRKAATIAAVEGEKYEMTEFGRRRISRTHRWLVLLGWVSSVITVPTIFIYRRVRRMLDRHSIKPAA